MADANSKAETLDVVIAACGVMEQPIPGTATLIRLRMGLGSCAIEAFDVNATGLSFLMALDVLLMGIATGPWQRGLRVAADIASAALDFTQPEASVVFGEGAAAAVEAGGPSQFFSNAIGLR